MFGIVLSDAQLGTDVCGGASPSMLSAIREALKVSNLVSLGDRRPQTGHAWEPLATCEAFHLATAAGARSLRVDDLTGDFSVGGALFARASALTSACMCTCLMHLHHVRL